MKALGNRFALEIHSHPTKVLFEYSPQEMRKELYQRHQSAGDIVHILKLCDVETVGTNWERLKIWTELARETAET
ncbi:MAG: hypothetical protein ACUVTY_02395 [Armatimonadota bacterium]